MIPPQFEENAAAYDLGTGEIITGLNSPAYDFDNKTYFYRVGNSPRKIAEHRLAALDNLTPLENRAAFYMRLYRAYIARRDMIAAQKSYNRMKRIKAQIEAICKITKCP